MLVTSIFSFSTKFSILSVSNTNFAISDLCIMKAFTGCQKKINIYTIISIMNSAVNRKFVQVLSFI